MSTIYFAPRVPAQTISRRQTHDMKAAASTLAPSCVLLAALAVATVAVVLLPSVSLPSWDLQALAYEFAGCCR